MMRDFTERLGHILGFTSLLILLELSRAFQPRTRKISSPPAAAQTEGGISGLDVHNALNILPEARGRFQKPNFDVDIDIDIDIDLDKARDFANHFGKYSYEEIEHMRDDLHTHRIQSLILVGEHNSSPSDLLFLERFLEDDLTSQLQALTEDMPDPYLFRYPDQDLPFKIATSSESEIPIHSLKEVLFGWETTAAPESPHDEKKRFDPPGNILGEGVLESLAICVILGLLMMIPEQIF